MKICIIIPIYNEAKTIASLVETLRLKGFSVVVVDDGSTDRGGRLAQEKGAVVLQHEKNQGKGASLQDGFNYALREDFDAVLTMDGDGQHTIEDIPNFIAEAQKHKDYVVTGSRMHNPKGMPTVRLYTNRFMSSMISFCSAILSLQGFLKIS